MTEQNNNDELPTGTRLEEFEIERVLGRGGFGVVYLVIDHTLGKRRAMKEFLPGLVAERGRDGVQVTARSRSGSAEYRLAYQQGLNRFLGEARTLARLDHPHIVRVYRVLEANGTAYLVMPYYEGKTLAAELGEGRPEPARVQRVLERLLDGLRTVHEAGLLHRDLKPDNIYLVDGERPVLLDFGAARRVVVEGSRSSSNNAYTSGYAAIEQYGGSGGEIKEGPWTDLYGLGATIYEWITGNKPWAAPDRVLDDRLKPLSEIRPAGYSRQWLASVDKALALKPRDRHQSIEAWQAALGGEGKSIRGWLLPAAMVLGVAVAGGGYFQWQANESTAQHQQQLEIERQAREKAEVDAKRLQEEKAAIERQAQQAEADQCRQLAAGWSDSRWIQFDDIDPGRAVPACEQAVRDNPQDPKLKAYFCRALRKANRSQDALVQCQQGAQAGILLAMVNLGDMYHKGEGVGKDNAQAVKWFRKAAEQGYAPAQSQLGWMYDKGLGVTQDYAQAVLWYRKAAEQGFAEAQYNLSVSYRKGEGVTNNPEQSVFWCRKAAEQGYPSAFNNLGMNYKIGFGVAQDDKKAIEWFQKGVEQGDEMAQLNLGWMYENGRGVPKNMAQAVTLYRKAAKQGNTQAQAALARLAENGQLR
ncbi:MAG TPA: protein kinase [Candidatus Competibacteraceae bacterium]|nr:protein kinase [Candidatus Competibacteraceae bacterium]HRZ07279.1 protein kinase [Candidatus Competibacteraceae bacterium]